MAKRHITLPDSFESLFIRLEEIILANSGEDEFEEIFKLITIKLWSESTGIKLNNSINEVQIKKYMESLLKDINKIWIGVLNETEFRLKEEHLNVCMNLLKDFEFSSYGFEAIDAFFEFIVSKTKKGSKGQYFTPRYIIDFCINILNPSLDENILDPASGSGAFLLHAYIYMIKKYKNVNKADLERIESNLWGFDFDDKAVRISKLLMYVSNVNKINIYKLNSLLMPIMQGKMMNDFKCTEITTIEDYLRIKKVQKLFDIIVTNPPFAGEIIEEDILNSYQVSKNRSRIERDVLFIERCLNLLREGGRMAIILPDNKFGAKEWSEMRSFLIENARVLGVIGLPRNTFMPHTPVKTSILFLEKRKLKNKQESKKIFFGISEKSGKDSRGNLEFVDNNSNTWDSVDHDLKEIEKQFSLFLRSEDVRWCN